MPSVARVSLYHCAISFYIDKTIGPDRVGMCHLSERIYRPAEGLIFLYHDVSFFFRQIPTFTLWFLNFFILLVAPSFLFSSDLSHKSC